MRKNAIFSLLFLGAALAFAACTKTETTTVDSAKPTNFTKQRAGTFVAQSGTPTAGAAEIGKDAAGAQWVRLGSDFKTELGTGTATVYLSKSMDYVADPGNGNPSLRLVGIVGANGEMFYKVSTAVGADFTHVIIWCGSASVPFGYAKLQ